MAPFWHDLSQFVLVATGQTGSEVDLAVPPASLRDQAKVYKPAFCTVGHNKPFAQSWIDRSHLCKPRRMRFDGKPRAKAPLIWPRGQREMGDGRIGEFHYCFRG